MLHVLMGATMAAMAVVIATRITASAAAGAVAGALVALDPALVLYEAYALYPTLCAFLVMVMFLALVKAGSEGRTGPLLVAIAALSVLVLTRSLFHLALLVPAVAGAVALARRRRLVLVWGAAFALLPAGWYGKNLVQDGFFGASSWYGMGLWRVALFRYERADVDPLLREGSLDRIVTVPPFSPPSRYRVLGYEGISEVSVALTRRFPQRQRSRHLGRLRRCCSAAHRC